MADLLEGIEAYFKARSELVSAFHGGTIYDTEAPEGSLFPYAVYMLIAEVPEDTTGTTQVVTAQVQISAYHSSAKLARDAGRLLTTAFDKARPIAEGQPAMHCLRTGGAFLKAEGKGPLGKDAYLQTYDYEIMFYRYVPPQS